MRLRGTRTLAELANLGVTELRLECTACARVSAVPINALAASRAATVLDASRTKTPCPSCGSPDTSFLPPELSVQFAP